MPELRVKGRTAGRRIRRIGSDEATVRIRVRRSRWEAKRAITLRWFEVLQLAERMRRQDADEPVVRLIRDDLAA
ncbi:MAG: hypothetical protein V3U67_09720 [Gemmatimonadota bacterium]